MEGQASRAGASPEHHDLRVRGKGRIQPAASWRWALLPNSSSGFRVAQSRWGDRRGPGAGAAGEHQCRRRGTARACRGRPGGSRGAVSGGRRERVPVRSERARARRPSLAGLRPCGGTTRSPGRARQPARARRLAGGRALCAARAGAGAGRAPARRRARGRGRAHHENARLRHPGAQRPRAAGSPREAPMAARARSRRSRGAPRRGPARDAADASATVRGGGS